MVGWLVGWWSCGTLWKGSECLTLTLLDELDRKGGSVLFYFLFPREGRKGGWEIGWMM